MNTLKGSYGGPKPFRFESFWSRDASSWAVIKHAWNQPQSGSSAHWLLRKIVATKSALRVWNKEHFGIIQTKIHDVWRQPEFIQNLSPSESQYEAELSLHSQLHEELCREELLWKDKSRTTWLTTKDLNTKHFHMSTIIRRRRNHIDAIQTSFGRWLHGRKPIGDNFSPTFWGHL